MCSITCKVDSCNDYKLRLAQVEDITLILTFIKKLAKYENSLDSVTATEERLLYSLFNRKIGDVLIGEYNGVPISYAIYFYNFSTFDGKLGIYLEDIYVEPEYRCRGFGKTMLKSIAKIAVENNCDRIDWACLNWNKSAIKFYDGIGATAKHELLIFRLENEPLIKFAQLKE